MSSSQKATLGLLAGLVVIVAVVAVFAASSAEDAPDAAESTTTTTTTASTSTSSSTVVASPSPSTSTTSTTTSSTTTTTTSAGTTTETTAPETVALVLRPDGIGSTYFGADAGNALAAFEDILGDSDEDTGWVDQQENYGICLGNEVRFVRWGSLQVFFTDGPSDWRPAGRHFASYTHAGHFAGDELALVTADGLALGSPVGDVRAQFGDDAVFDDPLYGPVFFYDPPGAAQMWGELSGLAPEDTIESITGSFACGE